MTKMTHSELLKYLYKMEGTQARVAKRLGFDVYQSKVSQWLRGEPMPRSICQRLEALYLEILVDKAARTTSVDERFAILIAALRESSAQIKSLKAASVQASKPS